MRPSNNRKNELNKSSTLQILEMHVEDHMPGSPESIEFYGF